MPESQPGAVLDQEALLEQVGGDPELLLRLVELFVGDSTKTLTDIRQGLAGGDANVVERAAHRLKGSLGTMAATAAYEAAFRIERMGRAGELSDVQAALDALEQELERVRVALERLTAA